jgi:hypothetical protein
MLNENLGHDIHSSVLAGEEHLQPVNEDEVIHESSAMAVRKIQIGKEDASRINFQEISSVLVIVTGGGLSMIETAGGFKPAKGLAERLKKYDYLSDR